MPELLAFDDDASSKWWQKINEAMEVVFCDYNNLVLGCECVCEGSKRAELGRRWRRQNSENLHWWEARPKAVCNMLFVKVLAAKISLGPSVSFNFSCLCFGLLSACIYSSSTTDRVSSSNIRFLLLVGCFYSYVVVTTATWRDVRFFTILTSLRRAALLLIVLAAAIQNGLCM